MVKCIGTKRSMFMPVFMSNIKKLMEEKKVTVRAIAEQANLSKQTVLTARTDEGITECRLSTLGKIADALGMKTTQLYEEKKAEDTDKA